MANLSIPVRATTLSAQVAAQLEKLISGGKWPIGTRIPAESELVGQLSVSRNTIREALQSLVHIGLLEARVGDGTYVRSQSVLAVAVARRAARTSLREALEIRSLLEQGAAKLAAVRRSKADVSKLRQLLKAQSDASLADDVEEYARADSELHRTIVDCARNPLLAELYDHFGGALQLSVTPEIWNHALASEEVEHHETLVDAIANQDPIAAEAATETIIQMLNDMLLSYDEKRAVAKQQPRSAVRKIRRAKTRT